MRSFDWSNEARNLHGLLMAEATDAWELNSDVHIILDK